MELGVVCEVESGLIVGDEGSSFFGRIPELGEEGTEPQSFLGSVGESDVFGLHRGEGDGWLLL